MAYIKNFQNLAKNDLRKKALEIIEAGYEAINIKKVISKRIIFDGNNLKIRHFVFENGAITGKSEAEINLNDFNKIYLIGIGKGSALAVSLVAKILGKKVLKGIALDVSRPCFDFKLWWNGIRFFKGTHPLPSKINIRATEKIIELAENAGEKDLIIYFICGGGSALACVSEGELIQSALATKELTKAGAQISELNAVRKHLSEFKGGGLAKISYPATVISLIVSDVCGNDLSTVASGPTVHDKTTKEDAENVLRKYNLQSMIDNAQLKETPKDEKYFANVENILFVCNQDAITEMMQKTKELEFEPRIYSLALEGEAKEVLLPMVELARPGEVLLAAGETTVTLENKKLIRQLEDKSQYYDSKIKNFGKGGRNQEAVLGVINHFAHFGAHVSNNLVLASFASDGQDNTEAAGAIGDYSILDKARKLGLVPQDFLENHDSFDFFKKTDDLIFAEKESFNVADLMVVIKGE